MTKGRLFYIIGASGAGKDSLMRYAQEHLPGDRVLFVRRYITRPAETGGEQHNPLSEDEFAKQLARGQFAMHWDSHGCRYGIGVEIDEWLEQGSDVVVNGSRAYLPEATRRYPDLIPVLIRVSAKQIAARLDRRGREGAADIERRINRSDQLDQINHPRLVEIDNNGPLEKGGEVLVKMLRRPSANQAH